jgi:RNA polymerase sigma-70 factor (ECF subfamily)
MNTSLTLNDVIIGCRKNNRKSQELLYKAFYPKMIEIVRRDIKDPDRSIDCLNQGFLKAYKTIKSCGDSDFEDWLTKIIIKEIRNEH